MEVFAAVLKDLYSFVFKYRFGSVSDVQKMKSVAVDALALTLQKISHESTQVPEPSILTTEEDKINLSNIQTENLFESVGYAYVRTACMYALPTRTFDGVVACLKYGESFQILNSQGKWLNILYRNSKGWIYRDDITESNAELNPKFILGQMYESSDKNTIKLRALICDEFHTVQFEVPMQDVEYAVYKLSRKGRVIKWTNERPRVAGTWQRLLKGVLGVHIGVIPKTDSVMEYINEDNTGHVSYVESVYPDGSITISEVGHEREGVYDERTISKDQWKELRPIFIEIT